MTAWRNHPRDDSTIETRHVPCAGCGYDLFSAQRDGACPECGMPVRSTLVGDVVANSDPRWIRQVARGVGMLAWSIPVAVMVSMVAALVGASVERFAGVLVAGYLALLAVGAARVGAREKRHGPALRATTWWRYGVLVMASAAALAAATLLYAAVFHESGGSLGPIIVGATISLLLWLTASAYLRQLAPRISAGMEARDTRAWQIFTITSIVLLVLGATGVATGCWSMLALPWLVPACPMTLLWGHFTFEAWRAALRLAATEAASYQFGERA